MLFPKATAAQESAQVSLPMKNSVKKLAFYYKAFSASC
jgi:hypothetical protein